RPRRRAVRFEPRPRRSGTFHRWSTTRAAVPQRGAPREEWRRGARTAAAMRRGESDVSCEVRELGWCEGDQQVAESGESSTTEMTKGLLRGFGYGGIETTQQGPPRGSDPIGAATAIVGIGTAHNESCASETRHQAREIGIARDHPCSDLRAGQSLWPRRAQNSKNVVLRPREPGGGNHRAASFGSQ